MKKWRQVVKPGAYWGVGWPLVEVDQRRRGLRVVLGNMLHVIAFGVCGV